jgi:hypothetical protein
MRKPKKNTGNQDARISPVQAGGKNKNKTVSGHANSMGGSRQGNAGHEHSSETGSGNRQVNPE